MTNKILGAVEAGGTKIIVAVGPNPEEITASARIETTTPDRTIQQIIEFFEPHRANIAAFGVASFGPVRIDCEAPDWGKLLTTPKEGWSGSSFVSPLIERFGLPVKLDTDVNAAAVAEHRLGALRGVRSGAYLTVGTGIGGGLILDGRPVHGIMHPEIGHIRVLRVASNDDGWPGICPYHGDCLEGLASGPAIDQRWGASLSDLPGGHPAHGLIADYLGQACATLALMFSVGRIVIGGGVSQTPSLHSSIAARMRYWLGGYLTDEAVNADTFVASPLLKDRAGLAGAMLLAEDTLRD